GEAEQQPDERGLAGAVGAEEPERDAARHLEVDAVERRPCAEPLAETDGLDRERVDGNGGGGGQPTTVRTGGCGGVGQPTEPHASLRMNSPGHLIRSDEAPLSC